MPVIERAVQRLERWVQRHEAVGGRRLDSQKVEEKVTDIHDGEADRLEARVELSAELKLNKVGWKKRNVTAAKDDAG